MRHLVLLLSLTACSAGTPPPGSSSAAEKGADTPESVDVDVPEAEDADEAAASDEESEADDGQDTESATQATGTKRDYERVLELVLNDPELQQYLKIDRPDRFPVKVAWDGVPAGAVVRKAGQPVEVVNEPEDEKDPVLVFTRIEVGKNFARVRYRFDVEGIKGSMSASKGDYGWELKSSRINER